MKCWACPGRPRMRMVEVLEEPNGPVEAFECKLGHRAERTKRKMKTPRAEAVGVTEHRPAVITLDVAPHLVGGRVERIDACKLFLEELIAGPIEAIVHALDVGQDYRARYAFTRSHKELWRYSPQRGVFSIAELRIGWDFKHDVPMLGFETPAVSYLIGSCPVGSRGSSYTIRRCSS